MKKRGFLLMTVCILIVGLLAGCGAGGGQAESQTQSNTESETENESSAATTEESGTTETDAMEPREKLWSCISQLLAIQSGWRK